MPDNTPAVPAKNPLLSKTIWTNIIVALAALMPEVQAFIGEHPEVFMFLYAGVNIVLRLITKQSVSLQD